MKRLTSAVTELVHSNLLLMELSKKGACNACHVWDAHAKDCKVIAQIKNNNEMLNYMVDNA